jgi:hypothetical protein
VGKVRVNPNPTKTRIVKDSGGEDIAYFDVPPNICYGEVDKEGLVDSHDVPSSYGF